MDTQVLVVGAGPAGLATAGCLVQRGIHPHVIEQGDQVGASWRSHYDRLHLHTVKSHSALPGLPFSDALPRYVPREGVVGYLSTYADHYGIAPQRGEAVTRIVPAAIGWRTFTASGLQFVSREVVVATGANRVPTRPTLPGEADFGGAIVHSGDYRNPVPYAGQRVLVVGMGNTGAEIALDLAEHGVRVALSVRSPLNIVHRDVLGRPTQLTSIALSRLPQRWGDSVARLLRDVTVGNLGSHGLHMSKVSPLRQLREQGKTPVIDVGTLARIKSGEIGVHPAVERLGTRSVRFVDGVEERFDAVILATGYRPGIDRLFPDRQVPIDANGMPLDATGHGDLAGIHFVGFDVRQPGGLLRTIALQAQQAARTIVLRLGEPSHAHAVDPPAVRG
ncbi:MAG: NAD(P)/FAD-dependent oxidoreductase [Caldimonas sp.]